METIHHFLFLLFSLRYVPHTQLQLMGFTVVDRVESEGGVDKIAALGFWVFFNPYMYTDDEMGSFFP